MSRRSLVLLLIVLCAGCNEAPKAPGKPGAAPTIRATVVTIRTTTKPDDKTHQHTLVIANGLARHTGELDSWRLFDTKANTVTFVDDAAKTVRTESMQSILDKRRATLASVLPPHYPSARVSNGAQKTLQGVSAQQTLIEVGAFRRELWLGEHSSIPPGLFAMMHASETPSSPLAPMMRTTEDVLTQARGFPLVDRIELPYGKQRLVVERAVIGIAERDVDESTLALPRDYRDLTPKPAPAP